MAQAFPAIGIKPEIDKRVKRAWAHYEASPQAGRIVADAWPAEGRMMWDCGRLRHDGYKVWKSKNVGDKFRVAPFRCGRLPFCLPCTRADVEQRARSALQDFQRFTPKGKPVKLWHVVLTAPLTLRGEGWGAKACKDIGRFAATARRFLEQVWGAGVGGIMSYQDFGEIPFTKHHPHFDIIVNGYVLKDGMPSELPRLDFQGPGGRRKYDDIYRGLAQTYFDMAAQTGDIDIRYVGESWMSRVKVVGYSVREMVDFRKVVYEQPGGRVGWRDYEDDSVDYTTLPGFREWFREYRERVDNGQHLHRWFGSMSSRDERSPLVRAYDADPLHPETCECNMCDDWERLPMDWDRPEHLGAPVPA